MPFINGKSGERVKVHVSYTCVRTCVCVCVCVLLVQTRLYTRSMYLRERL